MRSGDAGHKRHDVKPNASTRITDAPMIRRPFRTVVAPANVDSLPSAPVVGWVDGLVLCTPKRNHQLLAEILKDLVGQSLLPQILLKRENL